MANFDPKKQQLILKEFSKIINDVLKQDSAYLNSEEAQNILSEMKQNFFKRDYLSVFLNSPLHLALYMANYVPSRTLCYYDLFTEKYLILSDIILGRYQAREKELEKRRRQRKALDMKSVKESLDEIQSDNSENQVKIMSIGSGPGSELVALLKIISEAIKEPKFKFSYQTFSEFEDSISGCHASNIQIDLLDKAAWHQLQDILQTHFLNSLDIPSSLLSLQFHQIDILEAIKTKEWQKKISNTNLITFMFVMNELFASSKKKTIDMLQILLKNMKSKSFLLVVESAGSFSELSVGSKDFMIYRLLDSIPSLQKVHADDAVWFRYAKDLKFPLPLNHIRYFIRLYQRK